MLPWCTTSNSNSDRLGWHRTRLLDASATYRIPRRAMLSVRILTWEPSRYASVVRKSRPRRDTLCRGYRRCFPRLWGISANDQSICLVILAAAAGEPSRLGDHRRRCPECRHLWISLTQIQEPRLALFKFLSSASRSSRESFSKCVSWFFCNF